jgi:DNA modification methylase
VSGENACCLSILNGDDMPKLNKIRTYRQAVNFLGDTLDRKALNSPAAKAKRASERQRVRIEWINPEGLTPDPENPRHHSPQQIRKIANDIRKNGFTNPILITQDNLVIAGHGRLEASKQVGLSEIPVIRLHLTKAQAKVRNVWDNRSSDLSYFDDQLLGLAMQQLVDLNIDIEDTGFSVGESDLLIQSLTPPGDDTPDDDDPAPAGPAVTRSGDSWSLGDHRIVCADAQSGASYTLLMNRELADAIFTDVPYNLAGSEISGKGKVRHRSFKMAAGEMSVDRYRAFLRASMEQMVRHSADGSLHFHCIDWRHLQDIQAAAEETYRELLNICVWVKPNGGMGSLYRSRHEFVLVYKQGRARHRNNIELGRHGRNRTNVWEYAGGNSFSGRVTDEGNLLALHPTVKPVQMVADAILDCTARDGIVLDPFLGSGSTLIAAERTGRRCFGMDIDPAYVDAAVRRWQRHTGGHAVHADSGKRFDDLAKAI